jgi:PAT family beta-lactamase induction signal transducer AmpG
VPSLYFSQGIPYVIVMTMSVVMYKRLGISNTDIALYTSWLYLPWVLKPLWSPLVDITRTKRAWVVAMQFLVALALAAVAGSVRGGGFFRWSLCLFWIMAFASATHDIAADGFYMLSMSKHEQVWWVGLRSTFFRLAMIVGSGLLVVLAGVLESRNGLPPLEIPVAVKGGVPAPVDWRPAEIQFAAQPGPLHLLVHPAALEIARAERTAAEAGTTIAAAGKWNEDHGFVSPAASAADPAQARPAVPGVQSRSPTGLASLGKAWRTLVSRPLEWFLKTHFPKPLQVQKPAAGNVGVIYLTLSQRPPDGTAIAVNVDVKKTGLQFLGLAKGSQGLAVPQGERLVFTATNWNQPALAILQLDPKLPADTTVTVQASSGNLPLAWSLTLFFVAGLFLIFSCWHAVMLPKLVNDGPVVTQPRLLTEFFITLGSFFQKPGIGLALAFILSYRFDEAQLSKVISPFLLDSRAAGGLGLATSQVGLAYGTFGVLALTCGGLLGGFLAARHGLKRMLPFMLGAMYLPKTMFLLLAWLQPENFLATCGAVAVEQFGYGFGFTAFMLYLLYFADGPHKTAHYALCTGFMTLGMMIPGLWSGWLVDLVGYRHFFAWVLCSTLPGLVLALQLKIDPQFGKRVSP